MSINNTANQEKKIKVGTITYSLKLKEKTASVVNAETNNQIILIPRSIYYEKNEYIITSISARAFQCSKSQIIQFPPDSEVKTIDKDAFIHSNFKNFTLPSSLINGQTEWIKSSFYINDIDVSPNNPYYKLYEDKFILGKSTQETENFDVIIFCKKHFTEVTIPSFIKRIDSGAFRYCNELKSIGIPTNSILETIESLALPKNIESITIPASLIELKDNWCSGASHLTKIIIDEKNPRYKIYNDHFIIGKSSMEEKNFDVLIFCERNIKKVIIPNFIKHIGSYAFNNSQLETIEIPPDTQLLTIGNKAFVACLIKNFTIPRQLTYIGEYAFNNCQQLEKIEIPDDSELRTIERCSLVNLSIENFTIPPHLTKISTGTFQLCSRLRKIDIHPDSELQTIEGCAFQSSGLESISIPSNLIELQKDWCYDTTCIHTISVSPKNPKYSIYEDKFIIGKSSQNVEYFDELVFCVRNIKKVKIPSFIKHIKSCAFNKCYNLRTVEIQTNSELQIIENYAFEETKISCFTFPPHLTLIERSAFQNCKNLQKIDIDANSKLQTIKEYSYSQTSIKSFWIPSSIKCIEKSAFWLSLKLKIIYFDENSEIEFFGQEYFKFCNRNIIILIPKKLSDRFIK